MIIYNKQWPSLVYNSSNIISQHDDNQGLYITKAVEK
jgi:hypothetical protein